MSAKDSIATQTCELSKEEFNDFLTLYPIPSEYRVILPKSNQTVFDAPPGYVGLYTHSFSLANLRLPFTKFFCEVLEYFQVHISRLNPFGCAKLATFVVMCKAYGCEPSVDLFRGFFNLCRAGKWLTFAKRSEKHVPNLLPKVITRIKGWHKWFFYVQDSIIPANVLVDILRVVRVFPDPILFLAGLKPSWEYGQQQPVIMAGGKEMAFRNFIYTEDNEDLSFLLKEPSPGFGTDSMESPKPELFIVHPRSVAARIKDRKCKTRGGSSRPHVKRNLLLVSDDDEGLSDVLELKDATAFHLKISVITPSAWKNNMDNHMDVELLDLHDRYYARQAVVDNAVNRRSRELLQVIEKLRGEFDVMKDMKRAREEECKELRAKCETVMIEFEKNPIVVNLQEKISTLSTKFKEHKVSLDRMMLESQKLAGCQQSLLTLESKVTSLEAEKSRLEAVDVSLRKELVHSDDMGSLVGRLVSSAILYGRCRAYEQVADMKEPFDLSKVKGYRSSYKKDHTQASNDLATATFPWFDEFVADPSAPIKALLSKKPPSLQRPAPSKTQVPLPFSLRATPSSVPVYNPMSPPADVSIIKP
ncbi:hypothetical protein Tco_0445121 [Tanacetum coccineum]